VGLIPFRAWFGAGNALNLSLTASSGAISCASSTSTIWSSFWCQMTFTRDKPEELLRKPIGASERLAVGKRRS
jgi:hypothetical protein